MLVLYTVLFLLAFVCFCVAAFTKRHSLVEAGLAACALAWFLQLAHRLV